MVKMSLLSFMGMVNMVANFIEENNLDPGNEIDKHVICIHKPKLDGTIEINFGKLI